MTAALEQATVDVEIVVPVHNEQDDLPHTIRRLCAYLRDFPFTTLITIADNASTDATLRLALDLAGELPDVRVVHLDAKGRGRALREVWAASTAQVVAYMDVDLSTDLSALLPLVAPLLSGHSDVAIGSRLSRSARVVRGPKRELISRSYNLLLRTVLQARFSDAQCGFKAMRTECAPARCCRTSRTRAGSSTPNCSCWPSAADCASPRCRSTGSTIRTVASTSPRPRWPTCTASPGSSAHSRPERSRCAICAASWAAIRSTCRVCRIASVGRRFASP
jgi:hypothetical protein